MNSSTLWRSSCRVARPPPSPPAQRILFSSGTRVGPRRLSPDRAVTRISSESPALGADFIPEMEETGVKQIQDINMQVAAEGWVGGRRKARKVAGRIWYLEGGQTGEMKGSRTRGRGGAEWPTEGGQKIAKSGG